MASLSTRAIQKNGKSVRLLLLKMFISCSSAEGNGRNTKRSCIHAFFLFFGHYRADNYTLAFTKPYSFEWKVAPQFKDDLISC